MPAVRRDEPGGLYQGTTNGVVSLKFILIGSSGVGKTAILRRLVEDTYEPNSQSTIGVEFDSQVFDVEGTSVKLQIWDTAGQERFRSIAKAYFRNAVGVVLVYDICERKTFDEVGMWLNDVHALCDPNCLVMLVGNKSDLASQRVVSVLEAEQFATRHQLSYIEASALSGENVKDAFFELATKVYRRSPRPGGDSHAFPARQKVTVQTADQGGKGCC